MLRVIKPKTRKAKRALDERAPKLVENPKKCLLLHGTKTSALVKDVISDIHHLKKSGGLSLKMTKKNENIRPFEGGGETALEFFSQKADCSLFVFGSHSKKRPHNLVLGRFFDHHLFDMVEVAIDRFKSIKDLKGGGKYSPQLGSKACFAFIGADFEKEGSLKLLKSILLDTFRGQEVSSLNLAGLDRVFICVGVNDKCFLRHCAIRLKKSGTRIPLVELIESGPCLDLSVRRKREAGEELSKAAMTKPKLDGKKKEKNVSSDEIAGKQGRLYMPRQDVDSMALRKMKGLKRERRDQVPGKGNSTAETENKKLKEQ